MAENEIEAWADIADKVLCDCSIYVLENCIEPDARATIQSDYAASMVTLSAATLKWATAVAAKCSSELLRQSHLTQKMRRDELELQQRIEAREKAIVSELETRKDLALSERSIGDAALSEQAAELRQVVHELEGRRNDLVQHISSLQVEVDERRARLQQQKISIGEELRELETQRATLAMQIDAQRVLLQQQQQKADEFRHHGLAGGRDGVSSQNQQTAAGTSSPATEAPAAAAPLSSPKVHRQEVGIAALQTVREQLRELRESNSPPGRSAGLNASSALLNSSRSSVGVGGGDTPSRPLAYTPSSPGGGAGGSQSASATTNPWKARLMKLQGDLKSLRADLGAQP